MSNTSFSLNLADARAAERLGLDQAEQREIAQRLAHRGLAGAELLRDARLDQGLARRDLAADDAPDRSSLTCSRSTVRATPLT